MSLPLPPVPQKLREMLKDYPEHIDRLQNSLNRVIEKKSSGVEPFERAIWMLEGALESFYGEARRELKAAEANGNPQLIAGAKLKKQLMGQTMSKGFWLGDTDELQHYLKKNVGVRHG